MKRIIAFLLLAVMCVMTFASCGDGAVTTGPDNNGTPDTSLADATTLLNSLYKAGNGSKTKADFDVVAQVKVAGGTATVTVTWTVDNDSIKIVASEKDGYYTVDLPEENATETTYTLTATLKNAAGETKEIKYDRILMAFSKNEGDDQGNLDTEAVYKIYVDQVTLGKTLYITAETTGGRYVKSTNDPKLALDFTMEPVEGGYKFKTTIGDKAMYLTASLNENSKTVLGYAEEGSVWAYEKTRNCWLTDISGGKYVMGTYGTFDTFCSSEERHITAQNSGVSQFPALLKEKTKAENEGIKEDDVTIYNTPEDILTEAYKLEAGTYLSGGHKYTLTGVISTIDSPWDDGYGNISVTIIVNGLTDKPIQLFRLSGEGAKDLKIGDTVTATGPIMMYAKSEGVNVLEMEKAVMGDGTDNGGNEGGDTTTIGAVTPVPGTAYKFYMNQTANGKVLFLTGEMNGYYMATTDDASAAADVYVEDAGEGKFYVYCMVGTAKKYLNMEKSGTHNNAVFGETAVTAYTYNTELKTMVGALEGTDLAFGTHGTYSTFGLEAISGTDIYVAHFGIPGQGDDGEIGGGDEGDDAPAIEAVTPTAGTAYKFYMNQTANGKVLFLTGEMNGYYMATTDDASAAADVYVEDAGEGKFYVYCLVGGAKKYLNMEKSGTHNNAVFGETAVTAYTYNTELKTMVGALEGTDLAFGTHGTYSTFGLEAISGTDIYVAHFGILGNGETGGEDTPVTEPATDAPVADIIDFAYSLADGVSSTNVYTLTGKVTEITEAYTDKYKNVSFVISIEGVEKTMLCYRAKGDGAETLKVGDTVTVSGNFKNYGGTIELYPASLVSVAAGEGGGETGGEEGGETTPSNEPAVDAPIADILKFAYSLEQDATSVTAYTITGVISRVTGAYNAEYGNVTVTIVINGDEDHPISCFRLSGEGADVLAAGYTVTVTGNFNNYNGNIQLAQGCTIVSYVAGEPPVAEYDASISFASADKRTEFSTEKQVWVDNGITVTNLKAGSTSNVADYAGPARFYKSTSLTIACEGMTKIEIICDLSKPIGAMDGLTIDGVASCTVDGDIVTIILSAAADSITINEVPSQIRVSQINIYKD